MLRAILGVLLVGCGFPKPADVNGAVPCRATACAGDELAVCGDDGFVSHVEACPLGCASEGAQCAALVPSNGLGAALDAATAQSSVVLMGGSVVDTDTGEVRSGGAPISVATTTVTQLDGPTLRVLAARSWDIQSAAIRGSLPVVFVAADELVVRGPIEAAAHGSSLGSGATLCGSPGRGGRTTGVYLNPPGNNSGGYPPHLWASNGFGGGGFGSPGGIGGVNPTAVALGQNPGGPGIVNGNAALVPLRGGCEGGAYYETPGRVPGGGGGGGAVQLVAGKQIRVTGGGATRGAINVSGGHGYAGVLGVQDLQGAEPVWGPTGGGSGGALLLEAPNVILEDAAMLLAGGGGGGGWGACAVPPDGHDVEPATASAPGGACPATTYPRAHGGDGATTGDGLPGEDDSAGAAGGGGGGLGRIRINTADGTYVSGASTLIRGVLTTGLVGRR